MRSGTLTLSIDNGRGASARRSWHSQACAEVLSALGSTRDGLTTGEAGERLARHGPNVLDRKGGVSVAQLLWRQINNPLIWVLIGIAVISAVILLVGTARAMPEGGVDLSTGLRESAIFAIMLAAGAIPEGLPAIVTIALAIGVQRMAARRAVVR